MKISSWSRREEHEWMLPWGRTWCCILFDSCWKSAWTLSKDCSMCCCQVMVQERCTMEIKLVEDTFWGPWSTIVKVNNSCKIIMSLWLKPVAEIYCVCSGDQKRFPVMKILSIGGGRGVLLSFFLLGQFRTSVLLLPHLYPTTSVSQRLCFEWLNPVFCLSLLCHKTYFGSFFSLPFRDGRVRRLNHGKMLTIVFTKSQIDLGFYSK